MPNYSFNNIQGCFNGLVFLLFVFTSTNRSLAPFLTHIMTSPTLVHSAIIPFFVLLGFKWLNAPLYSWAAFHIDCRVTHNESKQALKARAFSKEAITHTRLIH